MDRGRRRNRALRVGLELAGDWRPEAVTVARPMHGATGITSGRTRRKAYVCPAKMFRHHPDKDLRALAQAQAKESHAAHGPCNGRCRTTLGMFCKNDTTLRLALGDVRARRWRDQVATQRMTS